MDNLQIIKLALLTVGLQAVGVVVGYCFWIAKQKITKKDLFIHKKEITEGMIADAEIEIERFWLLLREAEDKKEEILKKIEDNEKEIATEKAKTPMDIEKTKNLRAENELLGYDGVGPDGKIKYTYKVRGFPEKTRKTTAIGIIENEIEHHGQEIRTKVIEREYLKVLLRAILKLIKGGAVKDFRKMEQELIIKGFK